MISICFQNGPEAPEIELTEQFEDEGEAKDALDDLARKYGTVEDAAAWLRGTKKPKHLEQPVEPEIPETSRLVEHVPAAPPSPEVEAKEAKRIAKAEAENQAERDEAAAAHAEAEAASKKAEAEAEVAKKK